MKVKDDLKKIESEARKLLSEIPSLAALAYPALVTRAQAVVNGIAAAVADLEQLENGNTK